MPDVLEYRICYVVFRAKNPGQTDRQAARWPEGEFNHAFIGGAQIGQEPDATVGSIRIRADSIAVVEADTIQVSVGGLAGLSGSVAIVSISPEVGAAILDDADVKVARGITIEACSWADADADAMGISASGGIAVGAAVARADVNPYVLSYIGDSTVAAGGRIDLTSLHNADVFGTNVFSYGVVASAMSASGSLVAGASGADAEAEASAAVETWIASGANILAGGDLSLLSRANNKADASATGAGVGLVVGVGVSLADATAGGTTLAHTDGKISNARNLIIEAQATNTAKTKVYAVSGGTPRSRSETTSKSTRTPR